MSTVEEIKGVAHDAVALAACALIWAKGDPHEAILFIESTDSSNDEHDIRGLVEQGINAADDKMRERGIVP